MVDTVCISNYHFQQQGQISVMKSLVIERDGLLLVDDLADTGQTFRVVKDLLPETHFATFFAKPAGRPLVDSYITEVGPHTWVRFLWDTEAQFVEPIVSNTWPIVPG